MKEHTVRNLPFWGLVAFSIVSPLSIAATNIAWVAALLLWLYQSLSTSSRRCPAFCKTDLDAGFGLFVLASALSLIVSLTPKVSLLEFRSLGLIAIYYLFAWNIRNRREKGILVVCLLLSSSLAALYSFVEFYTGWDFLGHYHPGQNKVGGFFSLHLTLGEYLTLTDCLLAGILLWARPRGTVLLAGAGGWLLMTGGIALTGAKGAFLGLLTGTTILLGLKSRRAMWWALGAGTAFLLLLAMATWGTPWQPLLGQFGLDASQNAGPRLSNTQRLYMWWSGFRISTGYFLHGVGLHAVEAVYPLFRHPLARDTNQWHLHNNFLQLGVTRGMFGLTAFLYLFFLCFQQGHRRFRLEAGVSWEKGLAAGVLSGLGAFLVCGLTEYCWGDSEVLMLLYMLLGLLMSGPCPPAYPSGEATRPACAHPLGRTPGSVLLLGALTGVILLSLLDSGQAHTLVRSRLVALTLGAFLLGLMLRRPPGGTGEPPARWQKQAVGCVVVFAGYCFTRDLWEGPEGLLPGPGNTLPAALFPTGCAISLLLFVRPGQALPALSRLTLFDAAVFAAPVLWAGLCLGTNLLLRVADGQQALLAPGSSAVLSLCAMVVTLYGIPRLLYEGNTLQRVWTGLLGLTIILHALLT